MRALSNTATLAHTTIAAAFFTLAAAAPGQPTDARSGEHPQRAEAPAPSGERAAPSTYQHDNGTWLSAWSIGVGETFWMHRFSAVGGADSISSVSIAWGILPDATPARIHIMQDPNNDGNPADRVLLASVNVDVQSPNTGGFVVYHLPTPVPVSGDFYVGVSVPTPGDQFPILSDNTIPIPPGRAYFAAHPVQVDPAAIPAQGWPASLGYFALRANGSNAGFTYQGRLTNAGAPYTGIGDIRATIYDAATGGNIVANTFAIPNVDFTQGLFSVRVPAASSTFDPGADRWLEIEVRTPAGGGAFNVLSPRQRITSAPTAISAVTATTASFATSAASAATVPWTGITGVPANISLSPWSAAPGGITFDGGLVGIGLSTPAAPLSIAASGGTSLQSWHEGAGAQRWNLNLNSFGPDVPGLFFSEHAVNPANLVLRPGGNVGISQYPYLTLDLAQGAVVGNSTINTDLFDPANRGLKVSFGYQGSGTGNFSGMRTTVEPGTNGCGNSGDIRFDTWECNTAGSREVMRIAGNGFVGIGTASPSSRLEVAAPGVGGGWQMRFTNFSVANFRGGMRLTDTGFFEVTNTSNLVNANVARLASNGVWTAVSDARLKTDVTNADALLDTALKLTPVNFRWKSNGSPGLGLIAQDARAILPSLVTGDESREMLTLDYNQLSVVTLGAIKELKADNDRKQQEIDELKARLAAIEAAMKSQSPVR